MNYEPVRVRFAPSPTGRLHIGNARTALYNWLYARKNKGGKFILRFEDTDFGRSLKDYEKGIMADLKWLGLCWDEGPDLGGSFQPYRQSERLKIYTEFAEKLLEEEKAYPCFCSSEELEMMRHDLVLKGKAPGYDGRCARLCKKEREAYIRQGRQYAVRFNVKAHQAYIDFIDLVKGRVSFGRNALNDFIILRSDKIASYNFAVVVDDALMNITHVIRGDDHLSNTPKQIFLYNALGFRIPKFAHLPMILDADKHPLGKRSDALSISKLREEGFLREAVINYIALLGWSSDDHREILFQKDIVKRFSMKRISRSSASFDMKKFKWTNKRYLQSSSPEYLLPMLMPYLRESGIAVDSIDNDTLLRIAYVVKDNVETLSQVKDYKNMFFGGDVDITDEGMNALKQNGAQAVINALREELKDIDEITESSYQTIISSLKRTGVYGKALFMPIRAALTGHVHGPELINIFNILKRDIMIKRIDKALKLTR